MTVPTNRARPDLISIDRPHTPLPSIPEVDEAAFIPYDDTPIDIQKALDQWQQTLFQERMRMYAAEAKERMFARVKNG